MVDDWGGVRPVEVASKGAGYEVRRGEILLDLESHREALGVAFVLAGWRVSEAPDESRGFVHRKRRS